MEKLFFVDTETTGAPGREGATFKTIGVHQISGLIRIDGEVVREFNWKIKPFPTDQISDEALAVGHVTREILETYQDPIEAFLEFKEMCESIVNKFDKKDKFTFIAYNGMFDSEVLRAWFDKCWPLALPQDPRSRVFFYGANFAFPYLDLMTISAFFVGKKRMQMENFKLGTVCKFLGIEFEEELAHDAKYDIESTVRLYDFLKSRVIKDENEDEES